MTNEKQQLEEEPKDSTHSSEGTASMTLKEAKENLEREMLVRILRKHGGKIAPTAEELGISRPTVYSLIKKFGVRRR